MKALYLKSYYYPESLASSYLGQQTQEALACEGIKMELYTPTPSRGIEKTIRKIYRKKLYEQKLEGMLTIHRFPLFAERKNPLFRAFRYTILCIKLFTKGVFDQAAKDANVIMVSSTPPIIGPTAVFIKKFRHIPIIYNLQDVFPDSLVGTGMTRKGSLLWKIGRIIEDFTYKHCDKIIVISEDFKRNIMEKGVPEEKIVVIYNWVDENKVIPVSKEDNPLFEEFGLNREKFTVVYAGNLGNAQNIKIIADAAAILKDRKDIQFVIFGTGGLETELREKIRQEQLANIILFPLQPYERVSQVYSLGDVCIVSCKAGLGGSAMPSKTWSIMSCGRPVLASFDEGELKTILESNGCGVFTKANDIQCFVSAIEDLVADREKCVAMGTAGRKFILENLTKEVGTQKYLDVIKSVIK